MELYLFENEIIREVEDELTHCFAYNDSDISADLCAVNLKPLIDAGIDVSNNALRYDFETKEWKERPINRLLFVRTIPEFKQYAKSFADSCATLQIEEKHVQALIFMAAIFTRTIHHLIDDTDVFDMEQTQYIYNTSIRPNLLKLYIALKQNKGKTATIRFGEGKPVTVDDKGFPWFHQMMERYLDKFLAVDNVKEAQEELEVLYPTLMGKRVKSDQLYLNFIMASTYTYISRNIIPSMENKITIEQCKFLSEFLIEFKFMPPKSKNSNLNNLQSTIKSLVIDSKAHIIEQFRRNKRMKGCPRPDAYDIFWDESWT